jgi:hypothetical protein
MTSESEVAAAFRLFIATCFTVAIVFQLDRIAGALEVLAGLK